MKQISLIMLFFSLTTVAQTYEVVYNLEQVAKNIDLTTKIKTYLKGNTLQSMYVEDFRKSSQESGNSFMDIPTENNPSYFKDLKKNSVTYNDHIRFKFFNIIDKLPTFEWKIETETKEILGYQCQKATLHFRGSNFTAFFTTQIPASDGPRKFSGLPGIILELKSDDSIASFHYLAETINFSSEKEDIANTNLGKKTITYLDYLEKYNEKYQESLTQIVNEQGEKRPMAKGFMEVLIKN